MKSDSKTGFVTLVFTKRKRQ